MKKLILLLTLFLTMISCFVKSDSKMEDRGTNIEKEKLETVTGETELLLYGCCVEDACTTCEDYNIILEKKIEYKGEDINELIVIQLDNETEDLYKYIERKVKVTGYINREEKTIILEKIESLN